MTTVPRSHPDNPSPADRRAGPNPDIPAGLQIAPEGVQVFTKNGGGGKRLVTLTYRKRDASRRAALDFPSRVLSDLESAGVSLRGAVTIRLSPDAKTAHFGCDMEVPIASEG